MERQPMFSIGDTVRIVKPEDDFIFGWNEHMEKLVGHETKIVRIDRGKLSFEDVYRLSIDNGKWVWASDYLECAEEPELLEPINLEISDILPEFFK